MKRFAPKLLPRGLVAAAGICALAFLFARDAKADIIEISGPDPCPGNIGAGLCNGSSPFSLKGFLNGSITFNINVPLLGGTEEWVLVNDTGAPVTNLFFTFSGSVANNASCQIANSHGVTIVNTWLNACSIVDSLGHTTSLGGTQIGGGGQFFVPPATITFSGPGIPAGASFNLDFVSMQGTGTVSHLPIPEPASAILLLSGLIAGGVFRRRLRL